MSLREVAAALERVVGLAGSVDAELAVAGECAAAMRALVEHAAAGSAGDEAALLRAEHAVFAAELERLRGVLECGRAGRGLPDAPAGRPVPRCPGPCGTSGGAAPSLRRGGGRDRGSLPGGQRVGDAAGHPAVLGGAQRGALEGHVRAPAPESHVSHTFTPGAGRWSEEAWQRIDEAGLPQWALDVAHHVEPQATSWMREARVRHAMVVLNRPACGIEHGLGCHQALPLLLPRGYRLTVASTLGDRPHLAHYDGRATT